MEFGRVTFELPHGTFHALQGGDPDGRPALVLHGFPDHPPTAKPFLAELARRGRHVLAPWLRGYAPSPTAGPFDFASLTGDVLALIDRLWRQWSPGLTLYPALRAELHKDLRASMPAPLKYYRQMMRPGMLGVLRRLSQPITVPLLQLHGADDGIVPPQVDDRHRFAAPASVTSCTSRPPKRSRNASRHGPRSGSLAPRARPPGWAARGGR